MKSLQRINALLLGLVLLSLAIAIVRATCFDQFDDRNLLVIFFMVLWFISFPLVLVALVAHNIRAKPRRKDLD